MQKVNLDNLPRKNGKMNKIDWINSISLSVDFIYEGIEGSLFINSYNKKTQVVEIKYSNKLYNIRTGELIKSQIGNIIGKFNKQHYYKQGDIINVPKGKLEVLDLIKVKSGNVDIKGYKYKCIICGNEDKISEYHLKEKNSCNVCSNKKIVAGINDIHTTHEELGKLFWNYEDGLKYTASSSRKIDWKCPKCQIKIKGKRIHQVKDNGLSCPRCSDGKSIPEKFVFNVLTLLFMDEFEYQKYFDWSFEGDSNGKLSTRVYDFYIPSINTIIEVHGKQHYEDTFGKFIKDARTLKEEQHNDKLKETIAMNNGIQRYIVIDCRYSELDFMKNNLINSSLNANGVLNLISEENWKKCFEASMSSLIKVACDFWESGVKNTMEIAENMKINRSTIINYLKRGSLIGWCSYNVKEEIAKNGSISGKKSGKKVVQLSREGVFIKIWDSAHEITRSTKFSNVSSVCNGKRITAGGFRWMFLDDYNKKC